MRIFRDFDTGSIYKLYKSPKFVPYKYTYLVIAILAQFVLAPLLEKQIPLIIPLLFFVLMIAVLGTLDLKKSFFRVLLGLGCLAFLFSLTARAFQLPYREARYFYVTGLSAEAAFFLIAIVVLVMKIFSEKVITAETIKGGIAVYFMMGFLWAFLYSLLILLAPDSISFPMGSVEYSEITYFSFTTLTTLGYGDVTPVSWLARNLTILESTFGQIYLTVLIARLVGLHIAGSRNTSCDQ
jgi:hypothetical protein